MIISPKILKVLLKNREHGDVTRIHESTGLGRPTIYRALYKGRCSQETFDKIIGFYKEKKQRTEKIVNQTIDDLN